MLDQWYFQQSGVARGPVSKAQLASLVQSGEIRPADFVWCEGMPEWMSAEALGMFAVSEPTAPPPIVHPLETRPAAPLAPPPVSRRSTPDRPPNSLAWPIAILAGSAALVMAGVIGWLANSLMNPRSETRTVAAAAAPDAQSQPQPLPRTVESEQPSVAKASEAAKPVEVNPALAEAVAKQSKAAPAPAAAPPGPLTTPVPAASTAPAPSATASIAEVPTPSNAQPTVLYQEIDIRRAPKFSILGSVTIQDLQYQLLSELKATPPDADGSRSVEQYVVETKLLKADELSRPMFEQSLAALRGWHFTYKLIKGGEIAAWKSTPPDGRRTVRVEPPGGAGFLMTSVMDEDGWKEMAKLSFQMPDTTSDGKPWVRQMSHDFGALGNWYGETRFVPKGMSEGLVQIDYTHEMTYAPPDKDKAVGGLPFVIRAAEFKPEVAGGSYFFNAQANRVERLQERFLVRGAIQTEVLGQGVTVEVEEDQMITVRIMDQNPWEK